MKLNQRFIRSSWEINSNIATIKTQDAIPLGVSGKEFIRLYRLYGQICSLFNVCDYVDKISIYEKILKLSTIKLVKHINSITHVELTKEKYINCNNLCNKIYKNDGETKLHCLNMCDILLSFSKHMNYSVELTNNLLLCACYHDIGKLIIPNSVLFSACKLSNQEWDLIKNHVRFINMNKLKLHTDIIECISQHHENVDGSGYPYNLKENEINEKAKIISILDVYEALTSKRSYKDEKSKPFAVQFIKDNINIKFSEKHANDFVSFIENY